jgi:nicotinate-nucleotide adenylyltransferase
VSYVLYGGLFDPPHLGHLKIARAAYEKIRPETLIWIPSKYPPHREVKGLSAEERLKMLKWWLKDKPGFEVSDIELKEGHSGYSIETIEKFMEKYLGKKLYLLIGSDEAAEFKTWKRWEDILKLVQLVIADRDESLEIPREVRENALFLENKVFDVSSTEIRKRIAEGLPLEGLVDGDIINYIKEHNLYR